MFRDSECLSVRFLFIALWPGFVALVAGCAPSNLTYRENLLHTAANAMDSEPTQIQNWSVEARNRMEKLLGNLDTPTWPDSVSSPVDMQKVQRAAGAVGRDNSKVERGLFRKHCVQCHGLTGDGRGPAASLLDPYPRDFRRGTFKFKSTPIGKKPTHSDIVRTLENGIPGTAMPAFGHLNQTKEFSEDVDALAHYVRYLSIRGEVERKLIVSIIAEEVSDETPIKHLENVAKNWAIADQHVVELPAVKGFASQEQINESNRRGKELFESELTACVKCHGVEGRGDGKSKDYDDWTKDFTIRAGLNPENRTEWRVMKKFGALKPVIDPSRNLQLGVFRGGIHPNDVMRRLIVGIEGSPMPPIARKQNGNPGLTDEDIVDLVGYVYSLSNQDLRSWIDSIQSHAGAAHAIAE